MIQKGEFGIMRAVAIFTAGVLFSIPALAETVIVKSETKVSRSYVPASRTDPGCGNPQAAEVQASAVVTSLGAGADAFIGFPALTPVLSGLPQDTKNWLNERLGQNHGPSFCVVQCVAIPADVDATYQAGMTQLSGHGGHDQGILMSTPDKDPSKADIWFNFARIVNASVATSSTGKGKLFCATAKNWSHNRDREFVVQATYTK